MLLNARVEPYGAVVKKERKKKVVMNAEGPPYAFRQNNKHTQQNSALLFFSPQL